jgi:hypothetical protein
LFQELRYVEEAQIARSKRNIGRREREKERRRRRRRREKLYTSCYTCYMDILPLFFSPFLFFLFSSFFCGSTQGRRRRNGGELLLPSDYLNLIPPSPSSLWTQLIDQQRVEEEKLKRERERELCSSRYIISISICL